VSVSVSADLQALARAGVELAPGPDYDPRAERGVRLSSATSRAVLDEIRDRMAGALGSQP
jgi:bifunctional pyridoxal-dependent enzyme with beta-cystathionase and maltose regulon repressor activities